MTELFPLGRLQQDCLMVLADVTQRWRVPAEALYEAIALQGWTIRKGPLPEGSFWSCDAWEQTLMVSEQFIEELTCPTLYQEVMHWVLAAALGQIRLQSLAMLEGKNRAVFAHTATEYAMAFLLPQFMLRAHPDVAYLMQGEPGRIEGWRRLCRVAEHFLVPTACVQSALNHYGWLDYNWDKTPASETRVSSCARLNIMVS